MSKNIKKMAYLFNEENVCKSLVHVAIIEKSDIILTNY
jgi:hypothetical protein